MSRSFVSIDIETTGFDPTKDDVIELAAVRYEQGTITERFERLVKPSRPIPAAIEVITGISDAMVQDAPSLEDVQQEFEEFIQGYTLIGHNVAFDIGFLEGKGFTLPKESFDTWKLSTILLPFETSHSLEILTKRLDLSHSSKHRAGDDAEAVLYLLEHLQGVAAQLPQAHLEEAHRIGAAHNWPMAVVFEDALQQGGATEKEPVAPEKEIEESTSNTKDPVEEVLLQLGRGRGERETALLVERALKTGGAYMYESGGGTHRQDGFTLPLLRAATSEQRALLLLPSSRMLQEVLDGPIHEAKAYADTTTVALLDEQSGYVCAERLAQWKQRSDLSHEELYVLLRIVLWEHKLSDSRFVEIGLTGYAGRPEHGLSAEAAACGAEENKEGHASCPWNTELKEASEADLVIGTHGLFIEEAQKHIGSFASLIVEQADNLYRSTTARLTQRWDAERARRLVAQVDDLLEQPSGLMERLDLFFGLVGGEAEHQREPGDESPMWSIRLDGAIIHSGTFWKVEKAAMNLAEEVERIRVSILEKDVRGIAHELSQLTVFLKNVFSREAQQDATTEQGATSIRWIEIRDQESVAIVLAPIATDGLLFAPMWEDRTSIVVLGDVLFEHRGEGTYLRDVLGLPFETAQGEIPPSFDYPSAINIFVADDIQEPGKPGYTKALAEYVQGVSEVLKGQTVALTTSGASVKALHREIALPLKEKGIDVLGQRVTGGKMKIREIFSEEGRPTTLLGGMAMWTSLRGLPEGSVRCVILSKFPFDAPVKPLVAARTEQYANGFADYSLPEALLTFRQGAYQFIQSERAPITFVVLDSRAGTRPYGNDFLTSLPVVGVTNGSKQELLDILGINTVDKL